MPVPLQMPVPQTTVAMITNQALLRMDTTPCLITALDRPHQAPKFQ